MQPYRVATGPAKFNTGHELTLTAAQILPRRQNLAVSKNWNGKEPAAVVVTAPVEFKVGEVIGLPDLDRHTASIMVPVNEPKSDMDQVAVRKDQERKAAAKSDGVAVRPNKSKVA